MDRGDIFAVSLDPIEGREQRGHRRVMVVSPLAFNRVTGVPWVVPITTGGGFARVEGFAVSLAATGLDTVGVVRCDQIRALDLKARGARFIERAPDFITDDVLGRLAAVLEEA